MIIEGYTSCNLQEGGGYNAYISNIRPIMEDTPYYWGSKMWKTAIWRRSVFLRVGFYIHAISFVLGGEIKC